MADAVRVVPPATEKKVSARRVHVSLRIKLFAVIAAAVGFPVVVALFLAAYQDMPFIAWLHTYTIAIFSAQVSLETLILVFAGLISAASSDMIFSRTLYDKIDALVRWNKDFREGNFARVPVLPQLADDELGDLGAELGISAAQFLLMREEAHTSSEEKSVFLTIAAHQLRTPLTAVSWSVESLLDPRTTEEEKQKLQPQLNAQLKRMLLVVGHILASAKIEEGKFGFVFTLADIVPDIDALIKDFQPLSDEKGIAIVFDHPDVVPPVYIDSERMSLALFDLIANAIDYSHNGGTVTIALRSIGERVEVSVADTGIGISTKDIPQLFTKFYRGQNARHVRPDGSGLGLYLVKNIITNHGSEIVVQSDEIKGGSRFSFSLPTRKP